MRYVYNWSATSLYVDQTTMLSHRMTTRRLCNIIRNPTLIITYYGVVVVVLAQGAGGGERRSCEWKVRVVWRCALAAAPR
jgi:hypothetical protein